MLFRFGRWVLDKSGGAVVGATVTLIAQVIHGLYSQTAWADSVLAGVGVAAAFLVLMLAVAWLYHHRNPDVPTKVSNASAGLTTQERLDKTNHSVKEVLDLSGSISRILEAQTDFVRGRTRVLCKLKIDLNVSSPATTEIRKFVVRACPCVPGRRLIQHKTAWPETFALGKGGNNFAITAEIEFDYDGSNLLPESLMLLFSDELGLFHFCYRHGAELPSLHLPSA